MSATISFKDDPRVAAYSVWIADDVAQGITHAGEDLHLGLYLTTRLDRRGQPALVPEDVNVVIGALRTALIEHAATHGLFLIDQAGGINESISQPEAIWAALQEEKGYAFSIIYPQQVAKLMPFRDLFWSNADELDALIAGDHGLHSMHIEGQPRAQLDGAPLHLLEQVRRDFAQFTSQRNYEVRVAVARHLGPQLSPQLDRGVPDCGASPAQLPADAPIYDGRGVIVGAVDYGCDFMHPNFRRLGGATRLLKLWDQNQAKNGPWWGRVIERTEIDQAIAEVSAPDYVAPTYVAADDAPYHELRYHPHDNYYTDDVGDGAHGTFVLDVAGGNGRATRLEKAYRPGVATRADLMFVQARKPIKIGGRRIFDPWSVVSGAAAIFVWADELGQPAVVNVSLNGTQGPHDGVSYFDQVLDWLCAQNGRVIVVGAGNFYEDRTHARSSVVDGSMTWLTWRFSVNDKSQNEMEIWYETANNAHLSVWLTPPWDATSRIDVKPGKTRKIWRKGRLVGTVSNLDDDPYSIGPAPSDRRLILLNLKPHVGVDEPKADEDWRIGLQVTDFAGVPLNGTNVEIAFNAWISRDDEGQSHFADGCADANLTLGTLACFRQAIVVGAYALVADKRTACHFSSAGQTRDNRPVPHVAALGQRVWAARSLGFRVRYPGTNTPWRTSAVRVMDGTSVAAPFVAGTVALMLQKNSGLYAADIKDILISCARPYSAGIAFSAQDWNSQIGYGLVSAAKALAQVP
jgi:subtilisin family serine protease